MKEHLKKVINEVALDKNGQISFDNTEIRELTDKELEQVGGAGPPGINDSCTNSGTCGNQSKNGSCSNTGSCGGSTNGRC